MKRVCLLLALACGAAAHAASAINPQQFAWSFAIETPDERPLQRVELGEEVYRSLARGDLAELRVFNADDELVEHAVVAPREPVAPAPAALALRLFPLRGPLPAVDAASLTIAIDAHGALIQRQQQPAGERISAWLIDAGEGHGEIAALELGWQDGVRDFVAPVTLQTSADLREWQEAGTATLVSLTHQGQRLAQHEIALARPAARYLRLAWPTAADGVELLAVEAVPRRAAVQPRHWTRVAGVTVAVEKGAADVTQAWEFDALGWPPVDRVRLAFAEANSMATLGLQSRADAKGQWRARGRTLFYRLQVDGTELRGSDLVLDARRERYWRVEAHEPLAHAPALELGWRPDELVFVARGRPPFRLAAGSASAEPPPQPVDRLLANLDETQRGALIGTAVLGRRTPLAGPAALVPIPPPVPWQRYLLWALLVGGVLVLLAMAVRLYRQLGVGEDAQERGRP